MGLLGEVSRSSMRSEVATVMGFMEIHYPDGHALRFDHRGANAGESIYCDQCNQLSLKHMGLLAADVWRCHECLKNSPR